MKYLIEGKESTKQEYEIKEFLMPLVYGEGCVEIISDKNGKIISYNLLNPLKNYGVEK